MTFWFQNDTSCEKITHCIIQVVLSYCKLLLEKELVCFIVVFFARRINRIVKDHKDGNTRTLHFSKFFRNKKPIGNVIKIFAIEIQSFIILAVLIETLSNNYISYINDTTFKEYPKNSFFFT
jgi:hypothetical protein